MMNQTCYLMGFVEGCNPPPTVKNYSLLNRIWATQQNNNYTFPAKSQVFNGKNICRVQLAKKETSRKLPSAAIVSEGISMVYSLSFKIK
ncbi:hypothetical protein YC2023_054198 [Brassica napus]